jgi:hypothetical protein
MQLATIHTMGSDHTPVDSLLHDAICMSAQEVQTIVIEAHNMNMFWALQMELSLISITHVDVLWNHGSAVRFSGIDDEDGAWSIEVRLKYNRHVVVDQPSA